MFTAAELVDLLLSRAKSRPAALADRPFATFPPTWQSWFLGQREQRGAITGVPVDQIVAQFANREPKPRPRAEPSRTRWQAFKLLWRQQWERAPKDERSLRRFSGLASAFYHLFFAIFWLWFGVVPIAIAPKQDERLGEAVQVQYIGEGTFDELGAAPGETASEPSASNDAQSAQTASAAPSAAAASPAAASQPPAAVNEETSALPSTPTVETQPLVVSEVDEPDSDFVLPPPVARTSETERLPMQAVEIAESTSEIEIDEPRPAVRVLQPTPNIPQLAEPTVQTRPDDIELIEALPEVRQLPRTANVPPQLQAPEVRAPSSGIVLRDTTPSPTPASSTAPTSTGTSTAPSATTGRSSSSAAASNPRGTASSTTSGSAAAQAQGRPAGTAPAGVGQSQSPKPGATPSTVRNDDWGAAARTQPGSAPGGRSSGLFDGDGSVRLPGDSGRVGGGLPPGTLIEDFEKIDRMGTWLKRPPFDYTPSRFDQFWKPSQTLLQEWVSRGIKKVAVPIPGTGKRIECTVSLLQAGGGCTVVDPNMQDQEATARKPPDIPFKPELQEDQDGLKK